MKWNDCRCIYTAETRELDAAGELKTKKAFYKFLAQLSTAPAHNVWFDETTQTCFGIDMTFDNYRNMAAMLTSPNNFLEDRSHGYGFMSPFYRKIYPEAVALTEEYVVARMPMLQKFAGSKILIVGAGPSTKLTKWEDYEYDYLWSCNHFFRYDDLASKKLDLVSLGNELSLQNDDLKKYLRKSPGTMCIFDARISRSEEDVANFDKRYPARSTYYYTRYFGRVGTMTRLICLATFLGASEVAFVGMDGAPKDQAKVTNSVFEPSKEAGGPNKGPSEYNFSRIQYTMFWDYILNYLRPQTKYQNIGETYLNNLTADISKQNFKLEKNYERP